MLKSALGGIEILIKQTVQGGRLRLKSALGGIEIFRLLHLQISRAWLKSALGGIEMTIVTYNTNGIAGVKISPWRD